MSPKRDVVGSTQLASARTVMSGRTVTRTEAAPTRFESRPVSHSMANGAASRSAPMKTDSRGDTGRRLEPVRASALVRTSAPATDRVVKALPASTIAPQRLAVSRAVGLRSLGKAPSPVAATPVKGSARDTEGESRRIYPRVAVHVRARISVADDPSRFFDASLPTLNLSVGGMFLESSFFLKPGTQLMVELELPPKQRKVRARAEVVRVVSSGEERTGFAMRFTEYFDGSEVVLATHFLSPVLREFLGAYAAEHRFEASAEYLAHTADVLAAWELKKAQFGGDVWSLAAQS